MKTNRWSAISVLAACAVVLPTLGSMKNPVQRPVKVSESVVWEVDLTTGLAMGVGQGEGSHVGRYLNEAMAVWSLDFSPGGYFGIVEGTGVVTSASGDQLFWKMTPDQLGVVQFEGGTGRFEGASGALDATNILSVSTDQQGMTLFVQLQYQSTGDIVY